MSFGDILEGTVLGWSDILFDRGAVSGVCVIDYYL